MSFYKKKTEKYWVRDLKSGCSTSSVWSNGCLPKSGSSTSVVGSSRGCRLKSGSSTSWIKGLSNGFVSVGCPWWCVVTPSVQNIFCNFEFVPFRLIQICSQYFLCWRFLDQKIVELGQDFSQVLAWKNQLRFIHKICSCLTKNWSKLGTQDRDKITAKSQYFGKPFPSQSVMLYSLQLRL